MKTLKIGVCGVGNVGGAVLENLANSPSIVEDNGGVRIEIIQVGARKGKSVVPYDLDVVTDLMEVARNPNIDVLVELIGGCDLAKDLIEEAIKNGKHIVTANKALIATYGDELFELAKEKKVQIGFEASVAGGTPVIKALREGLVANKVNWFAGILNGTTNFILSKMSGWRVGFCCGNKDLLAALSRIKSYFDYGLFTPIQVAAIKALDYGDEHVNEIKTMYQSRRDVLIKGLNDAGWYVESPKATMFVWAKIPVTHKHLGSLEFSKQLLAEAKVAVSPGIGFGSYGEGYVRFSLIENEHRSRQAIRNIKKFLSNSSNVQAIN
jgi:hypothetical protein